MQRDQWPYFKENYRLVQVIIMETHQGAQPISLLLRKGGTFDPDKLNEYIANKPVSTKTYELTSGTVEIKIINLE